MTNDGDAATGSAGGGSSAAAASGGGGEDDDEDDDRLPAVHENTDRSVDTRITHTLATAARGCLFVFIMIKSIAPLQELFSPSPWLHFYDEYALTPERFICVFSLFLLFSHVCE